MTGQAGLYSMEKHDNRGAARANLLVAASHDFFGLVCKSYISCTKALELRSFDCSKLQ